MSKTELTLEIRDVCELRKSTRLQILTRLDLRLARLDSCLTHCQFRGKSAWLVPFVFGQSQSSYPVRFDSNPDLHFYDSTRLW